MVCVCVFHSKGVKHSNCVEHSNSLKLWIGDKVRENVLGCMGVCWLLCGSRCPSIVVGGEGDGCCWGPAVGSLSGFWLVVGGAGDVWAGRIVVVGACTCRRWSFAVGSSLVAIAVVGGGWCAWDCCWGGCGWC